MKGLNKVEELVVEARRIARMDNWQEFVVCTNGTSLKALTMAIKEVEKKVEIDSWFINKDEKAAQRVELSSKVLDILKRSRASRVKSLAIENEIDKRVNEWLKGTSEFDYFAIVNMTEAIRQEVNKEFAVA